MKLRNFYRKMREWVRERVGEEEIGRRGDWERGRLGEGEIGRGGDWERGRIGEEEKVSY